jgi:NADPH:quinone reductase-like Zn-dependent oxidoreductase
VLVEVQAAAINPLDLANVAGLLGTQLPMTPGVDFAGVVVCDGDFNGQEVWGSAPQLGMKRPGPHARFVALPETWLSRKPERLTMTEAGAIGGRYLAARETMIEAGADRHISRPPHEKRPARPTRELRLNSGQEPDLSLGRP